MSDFDSTEHHKMRKNIMWNYLNKDMDYKNIYHAKSVTTKVLKYIKLSQLSSITGRKFSHSK